MKPPRSWSPANIAGSPSSAMPVGTIVISAFAMARRESARLYQLGTTRTGTVSRSHGVWIATGALTEQVAKPTHSGDDHASCNWPSRGADRYPNESSRNLRFFGTEPVDLADHLPIARRRREDVEAFGSSRRYRRLAQTARSDQRKSASADGAGLPHHHNPRGRPGRLLDPPRAAERRDRKPCCRSGLDCHFAPEAAGEDRQDRRRNAAPHAFGLQTRRTPGVCHDQGAHSRGGGQPPPLPRAQSANRRESPARQPHQGAFILP